MDYMVQTEKIFKYLDLNIEIEDKITISKIKQIFNNDLNLFGCFIKDFLMIKNPNKTIEDECLYNNFVLYFENVITKNEIKKELLEIYNFGKYYLTIVFEDTNDIELQNTILIVNSCIALDSYPYLMILEITPAPTVRPPSRIAKRKPSSNAIGVIKSIRISTLSPGMHISTPSGKCATPVTSVVRK